MTLSPKANGRACDALPGSHGAARRSRGRAGPATPGGADRLEQDDDRSRSSSSQYPPCARPQRRLGHGQELQLALFHDVSGEWGARCRCRRSAAASITPAGTVRASPGVVRMASSWPSIWSFQRDLPGASMISSPGSGCTRIGDEYSLDVDARLDRLASQGRKGAVAPAGSFATFRRGASRPHARDVSAAVRSVLISASSRVIRGCSDATVTAAAFRQGHPWHSEPWPALRPPPAGVRTGTRLQAWQFPIWRLHYGQGDGAATEPVAATPVPARAWPTALASSDHPWTA